MKRTWHLKTASARKTWSNRLRKSEAGQVILLQSLRLSSEPHYCIMSDQHDTCVHTAAEELSPDCGAVFTSQHLAMVLGKCFKVEELDDHTITEAKERGGQTAQVERVVKGLVPKCLDKDASAFSSLERTKAKGKAARLGLLSECRPEGCSSAVDLFLWLVEVSGAMCMTFLHPSHAL